MKFKFKKIHYMILGGLISSFVVLIMYIALVLPGVAILTENDFQVPLRIFTSQGDLIAEFGEKHRLPVKYKNIPDQMIKAIIATEDRRFYSHIGVDFIGLVRAAKELVITGKKSQGASTITMQVARNFFLSPEKTFSRKINEILLSLKIEFFLSKEQILELYLNKIFLGHRAYGIKAAARNYYGKDLRDLTLPQFAMLAGLPKAPSTNNPISNPVRALARRNFVLGSMRDLNFISDSEFEEAIKAPLTEKIYGARVKVFAPHVAEMIRQDLHSVFGNDIYTKGFKVYTTIDSNLQQAATKSLQNGLISYDERHGLRPAKIKLPEDKALWPKALDAIPTINEHTAAAVLEVGADTLLLSLSDGTNIELGPEEVKWALYNTARGYKAKEPMSLSNTLIPGDVVLLKNINNRYHLAQEPEAEGAIVSIDPSTGALLALNGGYHFFESKFNRAVQAKRQLGSLFKTFVFSAALENNFNLASIVNDAPVVIKDSGDNELWRPNNVNMKFGGPTNLRVALAKSRNLVAVRLLDSIGLNTARSYIHDFGFTTDLEVPNSLSMALGSGQASPIQTTAAYAVFANGGFMVKPYLIDRITDQRGNNILIPGSKYSRGPLPYRIIKETNAYLINSALQDVIKKGTGRRALSLNSPNIAGKTGTTNNQVDSWFCGYSKDLVTTVWVGHDNSRSLGEYAAQLSLPIWIDYMKVALQLFPAESYPQPAGIIAARVNNSSGLLTSVEDENSRFEFFDIASMPKNHITSNNEKKHGADSIADIFD